MLCLASFFSDSVPAGVPCYSAARWQPREKRRFPKLAFLAPVRADGTAIAGLSSGEYLREYGQALCARAGELVSWLERLSPAQDLALLCWCRPQRQRSHCGLMCHTIAIGWLVEAVRPDVPVVYLDGREGPVWGPDERESFLRHVVPVLEAAREPRVSPVPRDVVAAVLARLR